MTIYLTFHTLTEAFEAAFLADPGSDETQRLAKLMTAYTDAQTQASGLGLGNIITYAENHIIAIQEREQNE